MAAALPSISPRHSQQGEGRQIFILQGKGVEPACFSKTEQSLKQFLGRTEEGRVITVDASYIVRDFRKMGKGATLSIPGGHAVALYNSLKMPGAEVIKQFVEQGGSCLFFCSPCYMSGKSEYCHTKEKKYQMDFEFNVSPYFLSGPALEIDAKKVLGVETARAASVTFGENLDKECRVFWNGGGYYPGVSGYLGDAVEVARYSSVLWGPGKSNGAAICVQLPNSGPVVLCNVHPEIHLNADEVKEWCPSISLEEQEALLKDAPLQKDLFEELCRLAQLNGEKDRELWNEYDQVSFGKNVCF